MQGSLKRNTVAGSTLVETLVSMLIITISFGLGLSVVVSSSRTDRMKQRILAYDRLEMAMEQLESKGSIDDTLKNSENLRIEMVCDTLYRPVLLHITLIGVANDDYELCRIKKLIDTFYQGD